MVLPHGWALPDTIKRRFGERSVGRQRAMAADGHLLLVLQKVPAPNEAARKTALYWRAPSGAWQCSDGKTGIEPLRNHINAYSAAENRLDEKYDRAVNARDYFELLEALTPLTHAAKGLAATMQAARELIPEDSELIDLRDLAGAADNDLELLYTDARNALDFAIAKRGEEQSELGQQAVLTGHRLNILAAIFFPLMAVSGIFGMNLRHGFEDRDVWIFWSVFFAGLVLGRVIHAWVTHPVAKKKADAR
ncbi:MAG: hypothetical protein JXR37_17070 [Kiritimatiellae bacterium]|nr:hypothetical protein [Kiritimatiellia bacterium]